MSKFSTQIVCKFAWMYAKPLILYYLRLRFESGISLGLAQSPRQEASPYHEACLLQAANALAALPVARMNLALGLTSQIGRESPTQPSTKVSAISKTTGIYQSLTRLGPPRPPKK